MEDNKEFNKIKQANESIKTTDIKGKEYAEVNQRIKAFRMVHPLGTITTNIVSLENGVVTMQSTVTSEDGVVLATGFSQEKENSTFINKTSFIENCETSAIGRALGICGFGIDTSICSAEELKNALENQKDKEPTEKTLLDNVNAKNELSKYVDIRSQEVEKYIKKKTGLKSIDPGKLNDNELQTLTNVFIEITKAKKEKLEKESADKVGVYSDEKPF